MQTLGAALRVCDATVLPAALPDERFFSFWESADALLTAAAARVGAVVKTSELKASAVF